MITLDRHIYLMELTGNRSSAVEVISRLGARWACRAKLISDNPKSGAAQHWVRAMCGYWNDCVSMAMYSNLGMSVVKDYLLNGSAVDFCNKPLLNEKLMGVGLKLLSVLDFRKLINETILL